MMDFSASSLPGGIRPRPGRRIVRWSVLLGGLLLAAGCGGDRGSAGDGAADGAGGAGTPDPARAAAAATGLFSDVTARTGIDFRHEAGALGKHWLPEGIGSGGALLDYDGDGDLDLYLVQGGFLESAEQPDPGNRLYRNDGAFRFADVTEATHTGVGGYGIGCAAADYDADGDPDLYVTRLGPNVLLRNDDGRFHDVTAAASVVAAAGPGAGLADPGFGASAAFLDYDADGHLDLFLTNYVDWAPHREGACYDATGVRDYCGPLDYEAPSVDRLYRSLGDGRFRDVTDAAGLGESRGNGLGVICTDFDGDGRVDIFVANDQTPGFLWINQGDGTFFEDAAIRGCGYNADGLAIAGMGLAAEDLDDDGDVDLVVTNIHDQAHLALRNDEGYFLDATHDWGFGGWGRPYTGFGLALFDQDHDGVLDGMVVNGAVSRLAEPLRPGHPFAEPDQFLRRGADGAFHDASAECPGLNQQLEMGRGLLVGDLDNDGDVDAVITSNRGPVRVLRNENTSGHAWTRLDVEFATGGAALNARVKIEAGGRTWTREVRPHAGYLGTNDARIHVGLGAAPKIDRVVVRWPDGTADEWTDLAVNQPWRLRRGETAVAVAGP